MASSSGDLGDLVQRGYRFALSLTHDSNEAEDLIQDAWFSVLKARGPWSREYLFTTIRNRFIDKLRRNKLVGFEPLTQGEAVDPSGEHDGWSDSVGILVSNGQFDQALRELRPQERAVLYLSAVEGCTAQQIADLLDWPRGTVLSMVHRARGKLRKWLEADTRETT